MERYALGFICLQGGGLDIRGTATLTNTNVYSNIADSVRARLSNLPRRFLHRAVELTVRLGFAQDAGVSACILNLP